MRTALKTMVAAVALTAPVAVGWAYTAGATVGDGDRGLSTFFSDETVDEFAVDGYLITREGRDGAITMEVTGPDGATIALDDLPGDIAERVDHYENHWSPLDEGPAFGTTDDGESCYEVPDLSGPGVVVDITENDDNTIRMVEASTDVDGVISVQAKEFQNAELSAADRAAILAGEKGLDDLSGGTELVPCD